MRRSALVLAALLVAGAAWAQAPGELPRPEDGHEQRTSVIAPGVWLLAQPSFQIQPCGNVTLIEQADGLVLVDAGGSPGEGRRIVAAVRALSRKPVKAVILTHWHGDHVQGLSEILQAWPRARTIATDATRAHLSDPKAMNSPSHPDPAANAAFQAKAQGFLAVTEANAAKATDPAVRAGWAQAGRLFRQYARDMDGALTLAPTEGFAERLALPDRRHPVEARFLGRANTDGDAVVWLPRDRILVTGDTVVAPFPYGYGSYPAEWLAVIEKLKAFPFRTLIPGHGPPQHDRAYLDREAAALRDARAETTEGQARRFVGDDPWLSLWVRNYWLGPILDSVRKEARGEPIVQGLGGD